MQKEAGQYYCAHKIAIVSGESKVCEYFRPRKKDGTKKEI